MDTKLDRLSNYLKEENIDFAFINSVPNVFYLTGFSCNPMERLLGLLVFQEMDPVIICPKLEVEAVKNSNWKFDVIGYTDNENPWKMIHELFLKRGIKNVKSFGVEEKQLTFYRTEKLREIFPSSTITSVDTKLNSMRLIKSKKEIELMAESAKLADYSIELGLQAIREGCTELDIVDHIATEQRKQGIQAKSNLPIILFGDKSSLPHGKPGNRRLEKGEFILMDLGVMVDGYCSDITRTFVYKVLDHQKEEIYETVLKSNIETIKKCSVGTRIGSLDDFSRSVIADAGYGEYYPHRVGHGIGIEGHEHPSMNSMNDSLLKVGMVFTIEPGIYIPGVGGVRVEDEVLITADGPITLTNFSKELQVIE